MILEFMASLSYNARSGFLPWHSECPGSPLRNIVAMIEMHLQPRTANGTIGFTVTARRLTAKP